VVARYIHFVVSHASHLTSAPLREADIHLEFCGVHDVPQNQSPNATHMMGFTERFVGSYPQVFDSNEMWNNFMPEDFKALQKKQQDEIDAAPWLNEPYVPPPVFKVSPASGSTEGATTKAKPPTRTYGRSVPSKKRPKLDVTAALKEKTASEIEWDAMVEEEELMANPDKWEWC
jgi:hypothetical protein